MNMQLKLFLRKCVNGVSKIVGPERVLRIESSVRYHRKLNLKHPVTLSDKICYLEFKTVNPLVIQCSDKYEVRKYIESKGYKKLLVPIIGEVYNDANDIDFSLLPEKFVIKATYGCKMNMICEDKNLLDYDNAKRIINSWLKKGFARDAMEPHYKYIEKRIICESFLEDANGIVDYKIHCINGKPEFVLVCSERSKGLKLNLYDLEWNPINELQGHYKNDKEVEKPSLLNEMIDIATVLSQDFDFVRVDLYQIQNCIYFGELTFTPNGGVISYFTEKFDTMLGEKLVIKG